MLPSVDEEDCPIEQTGIGATDGVSVGVYFADGTGAWTYVSDHTRALIGQPAENMLGKAWLRVLHPDDQARVEQAWERAIAARSVFRAEFRFVHCCGRHIRVLAQAAPECVPDGNGIVYVGSLSDIASTCACDSRLSRALDHVEAIYRASPDMIFLHGPDGRVLDVNDNVLQGYGYTRSEMLSLPFQEFSGGCCTSEQAFELLTRARTGEQLDFEWCARRKNGEEFPVEVRLRRLGDGVGENAPSVIAIVRDITDRKRIAEALRESEEKYRLTMDACVAGIYVIQEMTFRYVNPAMGRLFGYLPEDMVGGLQPGELLAPTQRAMVGCLTRGTGNDASAISCIRKDGSIFDAVVWGKQTTYEGRPAVVGTLIDISRRRQAEQALGESERRFKVITANLPGAVFQARADGVSLAELGFVSRAAYVLFERPVHVFRQAPERFLECIHVDDQESYLNSMKESIATFRDWNWEGRLVLSDERVKWIAWRATPRTLSGPSVLWDGVVLDITDTKKAQEELSHYRDRLRQLLSREHTLMEQERASIAAEIHDEFGSLLMALKMNLHTVASTVLSGQPDLAERFDAMSGLIGEAVGTIRRIATELRPRILDDFGLVAAMEWHIQEFKRHTGIECELTSDDPLPDLPPDLATALFRILQESLTNIARHSGAKRVQVHVGQADEELQLLIRDDGRGLDYRSAARHDARGIFGMRERALRHSGTFEIHGAPGKGTVVSVRMPNDVLRVTAD